MAYEKKVVEVKDRSGNIYGIGDTDLAQEVGNLNQAINNAPTEASGEELLDIEVAETELLGAILERFSALPTDESLQEIYNELQAENSWLDVIKAEVKYRLEVA